MAETTRVALTRKRNDIRALLLIAFLGLASCNSGQATIPTPADEKASATVAFDRHVTVDQFGYRPEDPKIAVIRSPREGYDSRDAFQPGSRYEVRRAGDAGPVFSGQPERWNGGALDKSSGDVAWWLDFSAFKAPGKYFIYDTERRVRSAVFRIAPDVYRSVLRAALRMYFYQRSGFDKREPYAEACWTDTAAYERQDQDRGARDITDRDNAAKARDLSGGWFDAGDTNKYVTFAAQPVHQLLTAFQQHPQVFTDDFGIPESGNGIPDVLDEVQWEIEWLKKMQSPDGASALKVGAIVYKTASPPSSDRSERFYVPACTSSTIAAAGMFAHAGVVFSAVPALTAGVADLRKRAELAWQSYQSFATPQTNCDTGVVHAGDADMTSEEQNGLAAEAAVYLYALTGDAAYQEYLLRHYREMQPYHDQGWTRYHPDQGESLLFYTTLQNADRTLRASILADKREDMLAAPQIYGFSAVNDPYRAFLDPAQYHWGSNNPRANYGNSNLDAIAYRIAPGRQSELKARALDTLHYFHGVNPLAMVYLSNMYRYGATLSANEIYHTWFWQGSRWSDARRSECGPAPGYVTGGPNVNAQRDGVPANLSPPVNQPPQKSYKDWNAGGPESSWAITEPAIYYQSAYIKLLSAFVN